jgi:hypothetical protein
MGKKEKKEKRALHQPTLIRQVLYTLLLTGLYTSLTVWSVALLNEKGSSIDIRDPFGFTRKITSKTFFGMIWASWICHIGACLLTMFYYMSHPSHVDISPKGKCHIWFLGTKRNFTSPFCSKG